MLTDDSTNPRQMPTRENMVRFLYTTFMYCPTLYPSQLQAMQWLVRGASPNDALFFHCKRVSLYTYLFLFSLLLDSGHGGQTKDLDGDEADGFDEGCSILFKLTILANTNDIYSYLSGTLLAMRY